VLEGGRKREPDTPDSATRKERSFGPAGFSSMDRENDILYITASLLRRKKEKEGRRRGL